MKHETKAAGHAAAAATLRKLGWPGADPPISELCTYAWTCVDCGVTNFGDYRGGELTPCECDVSRGGRCTAVLCGHEWDLGVFMVGEAPQLAG